MTQKYDAKETQKCAVVNQLIYGVLSDREIKALTMRVYRHECKRIYVYIIIYIIYIYVCVFMRTLRNAISKKVINHM